VNFTKLSTDDTNIGYVAGDMGLIIKSIIGGTKWTIQSSGTASELCTVFFTYANTSYSMGDNQIFKTYEIEPIVINSMLC
jgi:hypothetical protein